MDDLFGQESKSDDAFEFDKIYSTSGTAGRRHGRRRGKTVGGGRRTYYWVVTMYGDQLVVIGSGKDYESEAQDYAYHVLDTPFVVLPLKTSNRAAATSQVKKMRLDELGDLGAAISRASHQTPAEIQASNQKRLAGRNQDQVGDNW